jgi:hypothetical protein
MRGQVRKRKCKNCKDYFPPDHRNRARQKFCSHPSCRKASKADSQRRWLQKPENQNTFKGTDNVKRVQEWRKSHPGYWRRRMTDKEKALQDALPGETVCEREGKASLTEDALQDSLSAQTVEGREVEASLTDDALQDILSAQDPVLLGLIAQLTGSALQDEIANSTRRLRQLGDDIRNHQSSQKGGCDDLKTPPMSGSNPKTPGGVQLAGSPSGP